jgi:hypothetical protein
MDKDELLKLWTSKIFMEMGTEAFEKYYMAIEEIISNVYDVGFEAGKDAEKLERQLQQHGAPVGIGN